MIAAGIEPAAVAVLGIGGGEIAALEYRLGVARGARVGLIEGSAVDDELPVLAAPGAVIEKLPADAAAIGDFIRAGGATG